MLVAHSHRPGDPADPGAAHNRPAAGRNRPPEADRRGCLPAFVAEIGHNHQRAGRNHRQAARSRLIAGHRGCRLPRGCHKARHYWQVVAGHHCHSRRIVGRIHRRIAGIAHSPSAHRKGSPTEVGEAARSHRLDGCNYPNRFAAAAHSCQCFAVDVRNYRCRFVVGARSSRFLAVCYSYRNRFAVIAARSLTRNSARRGYYSPAAIGHMPR